MDMTELAGFWNSFLSEKCKGCSHFSDISLGFLAIQFSATSKHGDTKNHTQITQITTSYKKLLWLA